MSGITVARWTRYGHDRLYVQSADGRRLGYWDNETGQPYGVDESDEAAFYAALEPHGVIPPQRMPGQPPFSPVAGEWAVVIPPPQPNASPPTPMDLAQRLPGEGPRQRALAERQAAPVKTLVARVLGVHTDERAWRIGAKGEQAVGARLARLSPPWQTLHSITVNEEGTDIDHLVIGPGGVFTVNAKHHPDASVWVGGDTFLVDGHRTKYIPAARHEARRVAGTLSTAVGWSVPVTGIIAVMGATGGFKIKEQPRDGAVVVVSRREIDKWLARRPSVLASDQITGVYEVARMSTTWLAG